MTRRALTPVASLWEARADGGDVHPLLPGWMNPSQECCGKWTPDGKYYFFVTHESSGNIYVLRDKRPFWQREAAKPTRLTAGPLQFGEVLPSKDGKKLFVVGVQQRGELVRYDPLSGEFIPYLGGLSIGDVDFSRDQNGSRTFNIRKTPFGGAGLTGQNVSS